MNKNTTIEEIREIQLKGLKRDFENIDLKNICLNNSNIIIFGAGKYGQNALNMLTTYKLDKNIKAFCDNDVNKQGNYILSYKIISYFEAKKLYITPPPYS